MINNSKYILASAGTGKTENIILQIEDLIINKNVDVDQIAMITFTNKATNEIRLRLRNKLHSKWLEGYPVRDQLDKIYMTKISTIHSFCDDIIREYGLRIGISPNYKIGSFRYETDKIIDEVMNSNYNPEINLQIQSYLIKDMLKKFYYEISDKGIEYKPLHSNGGSFWDKFRDYFNKLYLQINQRVEIEKRNKNILTNNDLLYYATKLGEDETIAKSIAMKISYLFIDEGQDINYCQMRLFESLMKYLHLIIVGDEKQSIYTFRGSDKKAFENLLSKMKEQNAVQSIADTNYRSNDELLNTINKIFDSGFTYKRYRLNFNNLPLKGTGKGAKENPVFEIIYQQNICDIVKKMSQNLEKQENGRYNNIVILCRTNAEVNRVSNQLKRENIKAAIYSSKSLYRSKAIIDLLKVFKFILWGGEMEKDELLFSDYYLAGEKFFKVQHLFDVLSLLQIEVKRESISFIFNRLIELSKIIDYYKFLGKQQYIANLNRMKEILRDLINQGMSTTQIVDYIDIMIDTQQQEPEPQIEINAPVIVSTIHAFKGLSGNIVVIYNADKNLVKEFKTLYEFDLDTYKIAFNKDALLLNNNSVQSDSEYLKIKNKKLIENLEELRLLYVACTRAKDKLVISNTNSDTKIKYVKQHNPNYVSYTDWINNVKI